LGAITAIGTYMPAAEAPHGAFRGGVFLP
jgi:hypothetical protein